MVECAGSHLPLCRSRRTLILTTLMVIAALMQITLATADTHSPGMPVLNETRSPGLAVLCRDMATGTGITDVRIYIDGEFRDVTAGTGGSAIITPISPGEHSVRAVARGYLENISMVRISGESVTTVWMHPAKIVPIGQTGPVEDRIDIVFVPSSTQYDCTKQQTIITDYYTANEDNFRKDVDTILQKNS